MDRQQAHSVEECSLLEKAREYHSTVFAEKKGSFENLLGRKPGNLAMCYECVLNRIVFTFWACAHVAPG